ncbi:peptide-methionine (R)-S-oxide reductase [Alteromonadaceae bacterium Bs31]|nr:peptide-methionine (R)-S-oxide reductase [Alteromonadaceae bacterium Bs31]
MSDHSKNDDAQWREKLSPEEFRICREKGTEPPFSGEFWDSKSVGQYTCKCCDKPLFSSASKYDSGSGWPSFYQPLHSEQIIEQRDIAHGMIRTEILCQSCGSHLGHVFPDGPDPTGLRYCVNSASLNFSEETK